MSDQNLCVNPDYSTSFTSYDDIIQRLLPFHLYNGIQIDQGILEKLDRDAEKVSESIFEKKRQLEQRFLNAYSRSIMKDVPTELEMVQERLMFEEENFWKNKMKVEIDQLLIQRYRSNRHV
jgi:hypothetical protein